MAFESPGDKGRRFSPQRSQRNTAKHAKMLGQIKSGPTGLASRYRPRRVFEYAPKDTANEPRTDRRGGRCVICESSASDGAELRALLYPGRFRGRPHDCSFKERNSDPHPSADSDVDWHGFRYVSQSEPVPGRRRTRRDSDAIWNRTDLSTARPPTWHPPTRSPILPRQIRFLRSCATTTP